VSRVLAQGGDDVASELDRPRPPRLRHVEAGGRQRARHPDPGALEIDVLPAQRSQLADPQPRADRRDEEDPPLRLGDSDHPPRFVEGEELRIMDVLADHLEGRHPAEHLPPRRQVEERAEDCEMVVDGVRGEAGSAAGGLARAIDGGRASAGAEVCPRSGAACRPCRRRSSGP
jgi:hypothetical protein